MTTLHRPGKALFAYTPTTFSNKSITTATRSSIFLAVCHYLCKAEVDVVNPRHNRVSYSASQNRGDHHGLQKAGQAPYICAVDREVE